MAYLALSAIAIATLRGASTGRFIGVMEELKAFAKVITAVSIVGRLNGFITGEAYGVRKATTLTPQPIDINIAKLASSIAFLVYDVLGTVKFLEDAALVAKGVGNTIGAWTVGDKADVARSFFGYIGCGFSLADTFNMVVKDGITKKAFLSASISFVRIVGFISPRGTLVSELSGGTASLLSLLQSLNTIRV
jgi:hypothetical protein